MTKSSITTADFLIPELDCPDELGLIEKILASQPGIVSLTPDYLHRSLRVEFNAAQIDSMQIAAAITAGGFPAQAVTADASVQDSWQRPRVEGSTIVGGVLLVVAAGVRLGIGEATPLDATLAVLSTMASGHPVMQAAWRAIRLRSFDMNVLMSLAAFGAIGTGEYFEAATAMFLFGISLWLESFSMDRARRSVRSLVELTPSVAHRLLPASDDAESAVETQDVDPTELAIDDCVLVLPGERIPIDGEVAEGGSSVNQAPITGESVPVEKVPGEFAYAGTLNGEGSLTLRVTRLAQESTVAHIARLVQQAQAGRSPTERFVDQFARRYTPAVIVLAVLLAVVPLLFEYVSVGSVSSAIAKQWFHRSLVLLVIACPCALVISTPVTIVSGLYRAARRGLLVKGGQFLEMAGRVDAVAIDKTGTLTTGEMQVVGVHSAPGCDDDQVFRIAAMLEQHSEHPLARAIVDEAQRRSVMLNSVAEFTALRGFGVRGVIGGVTYHVGNLRLLGEVLSEAETPPGVSDSSETVVVVFDSTRWIGTIRLADSLRADAAEAIDQLKRLGVEQITVLTGDRQGVADRVTGNLSVDSVLADLLPEDKVARVSELATESTLAMVGDGVNDAPALAASDLGIALGSQASDTALETADVVVMTPKLTRLPELLRLGRRTRQLLRQNITFALLAKLVVLVLAALGLATMWMAVAADVGASLIVIANGMRLLGRE